MHSTSPIQIPLLPLTSLRLDYPLLPLFLYIYNHSLNKALKTPSRHLAPLALFVFIVYFFFFCVHCFHHAYANFSCHWVAVCILMFLLLNEYIHTEGDPIIQLSHCAMTSFCHDIPWPHYTMTSFSDDLIWLQPHYATTLFYHHLESTGHPTSYVEDEKMK